MGHKRKASDSLSTSSSPLMTSPSHLNNNPQQPYRSSHSNHISLSGWGSPEPYFANGILNSSPYHSSTGTRSDHLNSRTRKRFRDNRPDEETIHQITLSKLYAAQRNGAHKAVPEDHQQQQGIPSPTSSRASLPSTTTSLSQSQQKSKVAHQTSLHAFFSASSNTSSNSQQPKSTHGRPPTTPGPDPQSSTTPHPPTTTIACCEDCSAPLFSSSYSYSSSSLPLNSTYHSDSGHVDTEMMDVDTDLVFNVHSSSSGLDADADADSQAYLCAICGRHVCDMCAVRGDARVCLECANPGSGNGSVYGFGNSSSSGAVATGAGVGVSCGMEAGSISNHRYRGGTQGGRVGGGGGMALGEKRWVGGIGWM